MTRQRANEALEDRTQQPETAAPRLNAAQLDLIVRRIDGLSTFPVVAARALRLADRLGGEPREALDELSLLIAADPALAARTLGLANEMTDARPRTIADAVARSGLDGVRSALLCLPIVDMTNPPAAEDGFDRPALWCHCLAVGIASEWLAGRVGGIDPDEAYTAGLLHDLGKLVLAEAVPKSFARACQAARSHHAALAEYERRLLGVDHAVAGRRLAERWRLPAVVRSAIWLHAQYAGAVPASVAEADLVRVVGVANDLARARRVGFSGSSAPLLSCEELAVRLDLAPADIAEIGDALAEAVEERVAVLGLDDARAGDTETAAPLADRARRLGRAHQRLLRNERRESRSAEAMARAAAFAERLGPEAEVADALVLACEAFAAPAPEGGLLPTFAYGLSAGEESLLAVRHVGGGEADAWAVSVAGTGDVGALTGMSAREVLGRLDRDGLLASAELDGYVHRPLRSGGRAIGGVLYPGEAVGPVAEGLDAVLGMALGLVRERSSSALLSEELAGASQVMATAQEAVAEAKVLAAVGDLAAGAAHELNNPLAVVSGRAQLMRERARSDKQRRTWATIAEQAQRISDIISELMEFASPPEPRVEPVDPAELLAGAEEDFSSSDHPQAGSSRVDIEIDDETPAIEADRSQIGSVLLELMTNAATAAGEAPHIRLSARPDDVNGAVLVTVCDNGPGMDETTAARAYTPFFSAQQAGRRRGLGLPRAKRYVENNRGRIWIDSEPGEGTRVTLQLPAVPADRRGRSRIAEGD